MLKHLKAVIAFSIIPQYLLLKWISKYPQIIETYYSNGIYVYLSKLFRFTLGWLPFSFGDFVYTFAIIFMIRWFIKNFKVLKKNPKEWLLDVLSAVSIIYLAFHLFWGLNYYRLPLNQSLHLNSDYSTEQLISVTKKLIAKSNEIHSKISNNDTLPINIPYSKSHILKTASMGYDHLKEEFKHLKYHPKSIKKSLYSYPLTYMGFSGYLNPLTNEAQVDALIPIYIFPTTASHEIAHQLGYAAENEANFIGMLASVNNDDIYFKYSGYTFALRHCLFEIYKRDEDLYFEIVECHAGV